MSQSLANSVEALLRSATIVFWDFDGVIKDSVGVKSTGFEQLFMPYGRDVAGRVRQHHEAHGGVSRFEKMPVYLAWVGEPAGRDQVEKFCDKFSALVSQAVIDAAWVPGVREYLLGNHDRQLFVLITATPQQEIQGILHKLKIFHCFREIHGAPTSKTSAIRDALQRWQCMRERALVVGDSETDFAAAEANGVPFLLRRTALNVSLQKRYSGLVFDSLTS